MERMSAIPPEPALGVAPVPPPEDTTEADRGRVGASSLGDLVPPTVPRPLAVPPITEFAWILPPGSQTPGAA